MYFRSYNGETFGYEFKRMKNARIELSKAKNYDYILENDDLVFGTLNVDQEIFLENTQDSITAKRAFKYLTFFDDFQLHIFAFKKLEKQS